MKKLVILLGLALALSLVFATGAFANFGPHGGYAVDTDACAGCHRAHSSFSEIQFTPKDPGATLPADYPYALLVGNATTMTQFCNACHGDNAVGASTNVELGRFDSGPSSSSGVGGAALGGSYSDGTAVQYETNSVFNAPLNGGGFAEAWDSESSAFQPITSAHGMSDAGDLPLWGSGAAVSSVSLSCADCHDPHGATNYRLLKDNVNSVNVALNVFGNDDPVNYPFADGWLRGPEGGAEQMEAYVPDYTGGTKLVNNAGAQIGSLSDWCAACHTDYVKNRGTVADGDAGTSDYSFGTYADPAGDAVRHRHPMNVSPDSGNAILQVEAWQTTNPDWVAARALTPLEKTIGATSERDDTLGCLTCHFAHGASSDMSGWASASLTNGVGPDGLIMPVRDASGGVDPTFDSAMLRLDNRTVCEACHEK